MKFKTTQKEIKENFGTIIAVGYCRLQNLLSCENPVAYTVRREGWASDIYDFSFGEAIVTGYAPFGNMKASYDLCEKYEKMAIGIKEKYDSYEERHDHLHFLIMNFIGDVEKENGKNE